MFKVVVKKTPYLQSQILWHWFFDHLFVDVHHLFLITISDLIEFHDDRSDSIDNISKYSTTCNHTKYGNDHFISALWRYITIPNSTHCCERPVHTCYVFASKRFLIKFHAHDPTSLVLPKFVDSNIIEKATHVMSDYQDFNC